MYALAAIHGPSAPRSGASRTSAIPPPTMSDQLSTTVSTPGQSVSPAPRSADAKTMPTASNTWNTAAATISRDPIAMTSDATSGGVFAPLANTPRSGSRNASITAPHAVMYPAVIQRPVRANRAAADGSPAPIARPTRLVTAMPKPNAGMNDTCM